MKRSDFQTFFCLVSLRGHSSCPTKSEILPKASLFCSCSCLNQLKAPAVCLKSCADSFHLLPRVYRAPQQQQQGKNVVADTFNHSSYTALDIFKAFLKFYLLRAKDKKKTPLKVQESHSSLDFNVPRHTLF